MNRRQRRAEGERGPADLDVLAWNEAVVVVLERSFRTDVPPLRVHVERSWTRAQIVDGLRAAADLLEKEA